MGATKSEPYTVTELNTARMFKALGHPARLAIIHYLLSIDKCICNDIVDELDLAQATVSQHLRELKEAGLIRGTVEGSAICYCMDEKALIRLRDNLSLLVSKAQDQKKNCC
ncbi:MAG: ArsR/SmtB family transcription factor [Bacteroidota bacterium]